MQEINIHNYNFISRWWRSIDQQTVISIGILIGFSLLLVTTASARVAEKIGLASNYFTKRQIIFSGIACCVIFILSAMSKKAIKRIGILGFLGAIILLVLVKLYGFEAKGATRWLYIAGISIQPSEFVQPFFAVIIGWILSFRDQAPWPSFSMCVFFYLLALSLLILQPDIGMCVLLTGIFAMQIFIAGLPLLWIFISIIFSTFSALVAYLVFPHFSSRINKFLDPLSSENYQVSKSLLAYEHGGLYGTGPGEGIIKQHLPDSHTDFIFAVAGEELGTLVCIMVIGLFAIIVIRNLLNIQHEKDKFVQLAVIGLVTQLAMKSIINIGVTLNLLPTKGMTLPFISYGGSSTLAMSFTIGMLLCLSKKQIGIIRRRAINEFEMQ